MIAVQITKKFSDINVSSPKLEKLVETTCNRFKLHEAQVSIAIVNDAEITKLNKKFLKSNRTTDCLSFDLSSPSDSQKIFELIINAEMALREASLRGHSEESELALYITHGLLHNLGFNDFTKQQAEEMHQTEDEILQQQGYGLVYNKNRKDIK